MNQLFHKVLFGEICIIEILYISVIVFAFLFDTTVLVIFECVSSCTGWMLPTTARMAISRSFSKETSFNQPTTSSTAFRIDAMCSAHIRHGRIGLNFKLLYSIWKSGPLLNISIFYGDVRCNIAILFNFGHVAILIISIFVSVGTIYKSCNITLVI